MSLMRHISGITGDHDIPRTPLMLSVYRTSPVSPVSVDCTLGRWDVGRFGAQLGG